MISSSLKHFFRSVKIQWVSSQGDGEEHDKGITFALSLLSSNFLSSTEIVPSKMEYLETSSLLHYKKNYKVSTMSIPLKPVTFTLLFRCLSDSLSTPMPLDFTETQKEFIVIHLFYQMARFFQHQRDSKAWKKIHRPLQNFILYSACAKHKVHVSTVSLFSSSSCRVMLAAVLRHSRHCHTATALPLPRTWILDLCRSIKDFSPEGETRVSMKGAVKEDNTKSSQQTHDHACKSDL